MKSRSLALLALLASLLIPVRSHAGTTALARKLDPRLSAALVEGSAPVAVWVEFADKGEQGPGDLEARLAQAERDLTPRNRARRMKAGMSPLVDALDLPLAPEYVAAVQAQGQQVFGQSRWFNRVAVRTSGAALARLAELPCVARLKPVETGHVSRDPAPPVDEPVTRPIGPANATGTPAFYGQTYTQMLRLNVPAVHDSGYIGTGVIVCMLDEGFNYYNKHTATRALPVIAKRDFVEGDLSVVDTVTAPGNFVHGEWTLSTIGGKAPNIYVGPAYGAFYMLGRTEDSSSETPIEMTNWAMGAEWADSVGADVISSSLGYSVFDSPYPAITYDQLDGHTTVITRAAEIAASRGILVVNSAGNDGSAVGLASKLSAPSDARGDSVICAASVDSAGNRSSFSSKGPTYDGRIKPDLAAQGTAVLVASASGNPNTYLRLNGTSFSCPLIAGLAACLIQARPTWPATRIIRALEETATRANSPDTLVGRGIPNGLAALRWRPDTAGVPPQTHQNGLRFGLASENPVRSGDPVRLRFGIGADDPAMSGRVRAFDTQGRVVADLWSGPLSPGATLEVPWTGADAHGRVLRPGLYLVSFEVAGQRSVLRLVVLH